MPESQVHSFVIKLWLEQSGDDVNRIVWRGYITHVPDGERRYLKKVSDVTDFIDGYLPQLGANSNESGFIRWLRRLKPR